MAEPAVTPGWRKSSHSGNGGTGCVEVGAVPWRKSSYSDNGGTACVEVGGAPSAVLVRDTTNRTGATLTFPAAAWHALLATIRA
jgi:hypothetical protein